MLSTFHWTSPFLAGIRAALKSENRRWKKAIRRALEVLAVGPSAAQLVAGVITRIAWGSVAASYVFVLFAPAISTSLGLTPSQARSAVLVLGAIALFTSVKLDEATRQQHDRLLPLLSFSGSLGFRLGHLISVLPLTLIVVVQGARSGEGLQMVLGPILVASIVSVLALRVGTSVWVLRGAIIGAVLLVGLAVSQWPGFGKLSLQLLPNGGVKSLVAVAVAASVVVVTLCGARWLGKARLAPRDSPAGQKAAVMSGVVLAVAWTISLILEKVEILAHLADLTLIAGTLLGLLLLRVQAARFVNPEALGMGLLFARDLDICAERIVSFYRVNWVVMCSPVVLGGFILLTLAESLPGVILLASFTLLECAIDELAVQRRTVVLPASAMQSLGVSSLSGLGAGIGLIAVFCAAGAVGLTPSLDLRIQPSTVLMVSALALLIAGILIWLRLLDSSRWLPSIRVTESLNNV